jgi:dipeptidyl aminopeptidase/acylaminoacyl peptidase
MAGIAIADWTVTYEDESPKMRAYHVATMGGTPAQLPELHAERSPITYAANVRAPVLVIQARNDTRTPARQMVMYEAKLRELGKSIEVHWFEGGHQGARADVEQAIEHIELMLSFACRVVRKTSNSDA